MPTKSLFGFTTWLYSMDIVGAIMTALTVLFLLILCIFVLMLVVAFLATALFLAVAFCGGILSLSDILSRDT